ncbi:MAG: LysR family transcriptional regulator [Polyangiaceae bacterium]|nr:LysR family transcriptional regulator [Myxococcales bacterium]MCB9587587.1 LysR family transcriptional regulator [Polyangiaceae bacterium]MCB9605616.1 LysR family transcriptional regulator [Polyangiaceae bacterium]
MLINLELLRSFTTVASAPTFASAAKQRNVTASAISQQIRTLESQLGLELFERVGRNARLTPAGERLAAALAPELANIEDALEAAVAEQTNVSGSVRIGSPRPFGELWLRPRCIGLLKAHPALRLEISFGTPSELEERLLSRDLDLAILVRPAESPLIETSLIFTETFQAFASPLYLKQRGEPRTAGDFASHAWIAFDADLPMHASWWRWRFGARSKPQGDIACLVASLGEMRAFAEAGVGVAVLPEYFVAEAVEGARLESVAHKPGGAKNPIYLAWRKRAVPTARFLTAKNALLAPR